MKSYVDPYIDRKTGILKNVFGITDAGSCAKRKQI